MNTAKLITEIQSRNIAVEVVGDRLRLKPPSAVSLELAEIIRKHKSELLDAYRKSDVQTDSVADTDKQLAKFSKPEPGETIVLQPAHPLADFDHDSVFGSIPRHVQHKRRDCQSTDYWQHRFGGFFCRQCWPSTGPIMQVETDDRPEPRQESGGQMKPTTEWTTEEKQIVDWLEDNYDTLIDATETFQQQIDIAGLILVLRRGPAAQGSKQVLSDLRILKRNNKEFHAEMERRHEQQLGEWKPHHRREY